MSEGWDDLPETKLECDHEGSNPNRVRAGQQWALNLGHRTRSNGKAISLGKIDKHRADARLRKF